MVVWNGILLSVKNRHKMGVLDIGFAGWFVLLNSFYDRFVFTNSLSYKNHNFFLSGVPFVIAPSALLAGLSGIEDPVLQRQLYASVKKSVRFGLLKQFERDFGLGKEKLLEFCLAYFVASGWGLFEYRDVDFEKKRAIVVVRNSPFSSFFPSSSFPVDVCSRAILAAVFSEVFSEPVECVETNCSAMGEQACSFVVKQLSDFDFSSDVVRKQLEPD